MKVREPRPPEFTPPSEKPGQLVVLMPMAELQRMRLNRWRSALESLAFFFGALFMGCLFVAALLLEPTPTRAAGSPRGKEEEP